ncbi:immunoglobulin lambda-1 light chain-like isoform X1 [Paramisgurnus dabryanus]|uniref:immunoglobulin lambda-1 light chain-like isoform X1 n=1 Tax=Paramisgurnus dabryanus TaxID=90735 RepID=UPI003CCF7C25
MSSLNSNSSTNTDKMLIIFINLFTLLSCVSSAKVLTQKPSVLTEEKGKSVTMDCNVAVDYAHVSWYKQLPNAAPQFVLRYHHGASSPDLYGDSFSSSRFTSKAQSKIDYQLIINNVDVRDSAVYYCATWDSSNEGVFGQGTKLIVTDSGVSPPVVKIFPPSIEDVSSSKVTLVCLINDMSVGFADVSWFVNGNSVTDGVFTGSAEQQPNEKFKLSSYLTIERSEWEKDKDLTCKVTAAGKITNTKIKKSQCN